MYTIRRHDHSPRVELLPLIDVVFLLLTFFIYSLIVMVRAEILPVQLTQILTGRAAEPGHIVAITIDTEGRLYLNREPIQPEALNERLNEIAESEDPPKLFVGMQANVGPGSDSGADASSADDKAVVDRGPVLIELIEQLRAAGIKDFFIVGQKGSDTQTPGPDGEHAAPPALE